MLPPSSATLSSPPPARHGAAHTLGLHFPEEIRQAYERFQESGDVADMDAVVLAVMLDHVPEESPRIPATPADTMVLVKDLGFDSVAITEMVFFLEDLFAVRITNDEIVKVKTVGDLRAFVRQKLASVIPQRPKQKPSQ